MTWKNTRTKRPWRRFLTKPEEAKISGYEAMQVELEARIEAWKLQIGLTPAFEREVAKIRNRATQRAKYEAIPADKARRISRRNKALTDGARLLKSGNPSATD